MDAWAASVSVGTTTQAYVGPDGPAFPVSTAVNYYLERQRFRTFLDYVLSGYDARALALYNEWLSRTTIEQAVRVLRQPVATPPAPPKPQGNEQPQQRLDALTAAFADRPCQVLTQQAYVRRAGGGVEKELVYSIDQDDTAVRAIVLRDGWLASSKLGDLDQDSVISAASGDDLATEATLCWQVSPTSPWVTHELTTVAWPDYVFMPGGEVLPSPPALVPLRAGEPKLRLSESNNNGGLSMVETRVIAPYRLTDFGLMAQMEASANEGYPRLSLTIEPPRTHYNSAFVDTVRVERGVEITFERVRIESLGNGTRVMTFRETSALLDRGSTLTLHFAEDAVEGPLLEATLPLGQRFLEALYARELAFLEWAQQCLATFFDAAAAVERFELALIPLVYDAAAPHSLATLQKAELCLTTSGGVIFNVMTLGAVRRAHTFKQQQRSFLFHVQHERTYAPYLLLGGSGSVVDIFLSSDETSAIARLRIRDRRNHTFTPLKLRVTSLSSLLEEPALLPAIEVRYRNDASVTALVFPDRWMPVVVQQQSSTTTKLQRHLKITLSGGGLRFLSTPTWLASSVRFDHDAGLLWLDSDVLLPLASPAPVPSVMPLPPQWPSKLPDDLLITLTLPNNDLNLQLDTVQRLSETQVRLFSADNSADVTLKGNDAVHVLLRARLDVSHFAGVRAPMRALLAHFSRVLGTPNVRYDVGVMRRTPQLKPTGADTGSPVTVTSPPETWFTLDAVSSTSGSLVLRVPLKAIMVARGTEPPRLWPAEGLTMPYILFAPTNQLELARSSMLRALTYRSLEARPSFQDRLLYQQSCLVTLAALPADEAARLDYSLERPSMAQAGVTADHFDESGVRGGGGHGGGRGGGGGGHGGGGWRGGGGWHGGGGRYGGGGRRYGGGGWLGGGWPGGGWLGGGWLGGGWPGGYGGGGYGGYGGGGYGGGWPGGYRHGFYGGRWGRRGFYPFLAPYLGIAALGTSALLWGWLWREQLGYPGGGYYYNDAVFDETTRRPVRLQRHQMQYALAALDAEKANNASLDAQAVMRARALEARSIDESEFQEQLRAQR